MVVDARVATWREQHGLQARGQAGFWKGMRITATLCAVSFVGKVGF
jgi:hypothetical protein